MYKKTVFIGVGMAAAALALTIACSKNYEATTTTNIVTTEAPVIVEVAPEVVESTPEVVEVVPVEVTPEPVVEETKLVIGKCQIDEIGPVIAETDYSGKPAYVLPVTWTNVGNDATGFIYNVSLHIYQNGIECSDCYMLKDMTAYSAETTYNEIRPGATYTTYYKFYTTDGTDLEICIEPLVSFNTSDDVIITVPLA